MLKKRKRPQCVPASDASGDKEPDGPSPKKHKQAQAPDESSQQRFKKYEKMIREDIRMITDLEAEPNSRDFRRNLETAKTNLSKKLEGGVQEFLESQGRNAADEDQKKVALNLLKDAQRASRLREHRTRVVFADLPEADASRQFSEYETSIRADIQKIMDVKSISPENRDARFKLRRRLEGNIGKFLEWRGQNAADEVQKKAARDLLKDAHEASQLRGPRSNILGADSLQRLLAKLESRKAERLLVNVDLLEGSKEKRVWTQRDYLQRTWNHLILSKEKRVRSQLKANGMSEDEKEEIEKRLDRCLKFSLREQRIIDACKKLKLHINRNESSDEYRLELLDTRIEEGGESLEQVIEAVKAEWKGRFNPDLETRKTKKDDNAHGKKNDHDQYDGGSGTDADADPEEDIEEEEAEADLFENSEEWKRDSDLFSEFCEYPKD